MLARIEWLSEQPATPTTEPRRGFGDMLRLWRHRIRERKVLMGFTERDLHDVLLTRADVWAEIAKPFWRA
jgi:uncharacterized protein YjiS (DUF1127 family)